MLRVRELAATRGFGQGGDDEGRTWRQEIPGQGGNDRGRTWRPDIETGEGRR